MSFKPADNSFGDALRGAMTDADITTMMLSRRIKCSSSHLFRVLRGDALPSRVLLRKIIRCFPFLVSHPAYDEALKNANPSDTWSLHRSRRTVVAFAKVLNARMTKEHMSSTQLARLVGCHQSYMPRVRNGSTAPGRTLMERIGDALPGISSTPAFAKLYAKSRNNAPIRAQKTAKRNRAKNAIVLARDVQRLARELQDPAFIGRIRGFVRLSKKLERRIGAILERDLE